MCYDMLPKEERFWNIQEKNECHNGNIGSNKNSFFEMRE